LDSGKLKCFIQLLVHQFRTHHSPVRPGINVHHGHSISSEYEEGEAIHWGHIVYIWIWKCKFDLLTTRWKDRNDHTSGSGAFAGIVQPDVTVQIMDKDVNVKPVNHDGLNLYNCPCKLIATAPHVDALFIVDHVLDRGPESTASTAIDGRCLLPL
jgi:hypothetical protein